VLYQLLEDLIPAFQRNASTLIPSCVLVANAIAANQVLTQRKRRPAQMDGSDSGLRWVLFSGAQRLSKVH
jgi:hypothetical protein